MTVTKRRDLKEKFTVLSQNFNQGISYHFSLCEPKPTDMFKLDATADVIFSLIFSEKWF